MMLLMSTTTGRIEEKRIDAKRLEELIIGAEKMKNTLDDLILALVELKEKVEEL